MGGKGTGGGGSEGRSARSWPQSGSCRVWICQSSVGAARMGKNPKTSFLNPFCQSHDVKNLFIMDGSCFVTSAWANPTLTMMALAVRSCDYLKEEYRKGNLK